MFLSIILFFVSTVFAAHVRYTGWMFLLGNIMLLWGGILFAWQFQHSWAGVTGEFLEEILNCLYGMLVGFSLGLRYASGK